MWNVKLPPPGGENWKKKNSEIFEGIILVMKTNCLFFKYVTTRNNDFLIHSEEEVPRLKQTHPMRELNINQF